MGVFQGTDKLWDLLPHSAPAWWAAGGTRPIRERKIQPGSFENSSVITMKPLIKTAIALLLAASSGQLVAAKNQEEIPLTARGTELQAKYSKGQTNCKEFCCDLECGG